MPKAKSKLTRNKGSSRRATTSPPSTLPEEERYAEPSVPFESFQDALEHYGRFPRLQLATMSESAAKKLQEEEEQEEEPEHSIKGKSYRTKQTSRRSSGFKAPRKQLATKAARPSSPKFLTKSDEDESEESESDSDTSSTSSQSKNKNDTKKTQTPSDKTISSDSEKYKWNYHKAGLLAMNQQFVPKSTEIRGFLPDKNNGLVKGTWKCTWKFTVDEVESDGSDEDGDDDGKRGSPGKRMKKGL